MEQAAAKGHDIHYIGEDRIGMQRNEKRIRFNLPAPGRFTIVLRFSPPANVFLINFPKGPTKEPKSLRQNQEDVLPRVSAGWRRGKRQELDMQHFADTPAKKPRMDPAAFPPPLLKKGWSRIPALDVPPMKFSFSTAKTVKDLRGLAMFQGHQ